MRQDQHQRMFQGAPVLNNQLAEYQMMRFQNGMTNENLRQRAIQNNRMQP